MEITRERNNCYKIDLKVGPTSSYQDCRKRENKNNEEEEITN